MNYIKHLLGMGILISCVSLAMAQDGCDCIANSAAFQELERRVSILESLFDMDTDGDMSDVQEKVRALIEGMNADGACERCGCSKTKFVSIDVVNEDEAYGRCGCSKTKCAMLDDSTDNTKSIKDKVLTFLNQVKILRAEFLKKLKGLRRKVKAHEKTIVAMDKRIQSVEAAVGQAVEEAGVQAQ